MIKIGRPPKTGKTFEVQTAVRLSREQSEKAKRLAKNVGCDGVAELLRKLLDDVCEVNNG